MTSPSVRVAPRAPAHLRPLFAELGDLKRIRSAGRQGSIAQRGFRNAWGSLAAGHTAYAVMQNGVSAALAAARLGDLDWSTLTLLGLEPAAATTILKTAFDAVAAGVDVTLAATLRVGLGASPKSEAIDIPAFVGALEAQPRAGATCPGKPRLVLEPPENHAEHCWAVAVYGALLAPTYDADPTVVFIAGLAHHLHNAAMPDSGFTGEMLLGDRLDMICAFSADLALAQLDATLRETVVRARTILRDDSSPEGRAFHAADVIDRVMQIAQHLRGASVTMHEVLDDFGLVHDGPVKPFHDRVLAEMGLP